MSWWQIASSEIDKIYSYAENLKENLNKAPEGKDNFEKMRDSYNFLRQFVAFDVVKEYIGKVEDLYPVNILRKQNPEKRNYPQSEYISLSHRELEFKLVDALS